MADNIFAEIYNKILGLFGQTDTKEESKNTAVNRLRLVLMQDRTNLTPEIMHRMRSELIEVLSTYVELDKEALELNFEQEGEQMALMLSIPVVRAKDESEIEASIKEKEAAKAEEDAEDESSEGVSEEDTAAEEDAANSEENSDDEQKSEFDEDDEVSKDEVVEEKDDESSSNSAEAEDGVKEDTEKSTPKKDEK